MFKSLNRHDADDEVQDIHNDVSQLADSLESKCTLAPYL